MTVPFIELQQNAAGMNSWKNKNIFKSMTVTFIEL